MTQKDFFQQLKEQLHGHPFRDRFLEELEDHKEDLESDKNLKEKFVEEEMMKKYLGEPEEISSSFIQIMNPWKKIQSLILYGFSMWGLFFAWMIMINGLLVPWDGTVPQDRPPIGTWERTINDFFEKSAASEITIYILLAVSLLVVLFQIKKRGAFQIYKILDYAGITNFLYLGLLFAISFLGVIIFQREPAHGFNPLAITLNILALALLFYFQFKGLNSYLNFNHNKSNS